MKNSKGQSVAEGGLKKPVFFLKLYLKVQSPDASEVTVPDH